MVTVNSMSLSALSTRATTSLACIPTETVWESFVNPMVTSVWLKTAQHYIDCTMTDDALLLQYYKLLVSCACPYFVAITRDRVWSNRHVFGPSNCRNRCLSMWLMNPLVRNARLKSYHYLPYHSLRTRQTSWTWGLEVLNLWTDHCWTYENCHYTSFYSHKKTPSVSVLLLLVQQSLSQYSWTFKYRNGHSAVNWWWPSYGLQVTVWIPINYPVWVV